MRHPAPAVRLHRLIAALLAAVLVAPSVAAGLPQPPPPPSPFDSASFDDATRRAIELERNIGELRAEQLAIENHMAVAGERIAEQSASLSRARAEYRTAQKAYDARVVAMYKFGVYDEVAILLDAGDWNDLITRLTIVSHILRRDRLSLQAAAIVASQAEFEAAMLGTLAQERDSLSRLVQQRAQIAGTAVEEQRVLMQTLPVASVALVEGVRQLDARTREQWKASSVPLTTAVKTVAGSVSPHVGRRYLVSALRQKRFTSTGLTYMAVCSWYGPGFDGRTTASGQIFNSNDLTCASRTLPFGTWLALTNGEKRVVVCVNDRGPFADGRDLDLSPAAARLLGVAAPTPVQVEVVTPAP